MSAPREPAPAPPGGSRWSDHEVEQVVGRLLQVGVFIATAVVLLGAVALMAKHGGDVVAFGTFRGAASHLTSVGAIVRSALALDPRAIVQLGLVLLIATPVARVALTLVAFVVQRDKLYMALTTFVLLVLSYGLLWGS